MSLVLKRNFFHKLEAPAYMVHISIFNKITNFQVRLMVRKIQ